MVGTKHYMLTTYVAKTYSLKASIFFSIGISLLNIQQSNKFLFPLCTLTV